MVLGSSPDAEASLSPALSCLYGYDTHILYVQHSKCKMFHVEHCRDLQVFLVFHVEQSLKPCPRPQLHLGRRELPANQVYFFFVPFFAAFFAAARSCRVMVTTRSISSQGAGLPVQISNCRAAWCTNISTPGMTCAPRSRAIFIRRVSGGS